MIKKVSQLTFGLTLSVFLASCGSEGGRVVSSGKGVKSMMAATGSSNILKLRDQAVDSYRLARKEAVLASIRKASSQSVLSDDCGDFSVEGPDGSSCNVTSCDTGDFDENSNQLPAELNITMATTCTAASATGECKGVTYTVADLNMTTTFAMKINTQNGSGSMTLTADMSGTMSSSDNSASGAIDCKFGFSQAFSENDSGSDEVSCADVDFSCKVGEETMTCEDLEASANSCEAT
jgi:hypothetical protein